MWSRHTNAASLPHTLALRLLRTDKFTVWVSASCSGMLISEDFRVSKGLILYSCLAEWCLFKLFCFVHYVNLEHYSENVLAKFPVLLPLFRFKSEYFCNWYKWSLSVFQQNKLKDRSSQLNVLRPCENMRGMTEIKFILLTFETQYKRKKQTLGNLRTVLFLFY